MVCFGVQPLCDLLGLPRMTVESWVNGRRNPSDPARKLVWVMWCLTLHPEMMRSAFDIVTWGKFQSFKQNKRLPRFGDHQLKDWSDWSI